MGLPVIGHAVRAVGLPEGVERGQVMVTHAEEFYYTTFGNKPDPGRLAEVVERTRRSGAYVTPNLSTNVTVRRQWGKPDVREHGLCPAQTAPDCSSMRIESLHTSAGIQNAVTNN